MNVKVDNKILSWVIYQCRNQLLNERITSLLNDWACGSKQPTFNQIETVSKATGIPFGYFFLSEPPVEDTSLIDYRTVDSIELETPSRNLMDTIHDMELVQDWMKEYLLNNGAGPLTYVGAQKDQKDINRFAEYMRDVLSLEKDWFRRGKSVSDSFRNLRNAISNAGVLVMMNGVVENNNYRVLSVDEFRAFALTDAVAPLIFINSRDSQNGKLFSLAHEFVHVLIGDKSLFNVKLSNQTGISKTETICNAVAAEILVPIDLFKQQWIESNESDLQTKIETIAKYFHCGTVVIARRALDADFIGGKLYSKIAKNAEDNYRLSQKNKNNESGGNFYNTAASRIDKRFINSLMSSVKNGSTLYSDAYRLTNTNRTTFENLFEKIGGGLL